MVKSWFVRNSYLSNKDVFSFFGDPREDGFRLLDEYDEEEAARCSKENNMDKRPTRYARFPSNVYQKKEKKAFVLMAFGAVCVLFIISLVFICLVILSAKT